MEDALWRVKAAAYITHRVDATRRLCNQKRRAGGTTPMENSVNIPTKSNKMQLRTLRKLAFLLSSFSPTNSFRLITYYFKSTVFLYVKSRNAKAVRQPFKATQYLQLCRHLWADSLDIFGSLTYHNPISIHGLLLGQFYLSFYVSVSLGTISKLRWRKIYLRNVGLSVCNESHMGIQ
jgi:hypothetical protein